MADRGAGNQLLGKGMNFDSLPRSLPSTRWAASLPLDCVPAAIAALAALQAVLAARMLGHENNASSNVPSELIDAPALAARLGVAVSNVRSAARAGKIPSVRIGRYVRFDAAAVTQSLKREGL
jgi:excisionase family DNA binding protein